MNAVVNINLKRPKLNPEYFHEITYRDFTIKFGRVKCLKGDLYVTTIFDENGTEKLESASWNCGGTATLAKSCVDEIIERRTRQMNLIRWFNS
jgi:hypothetical protein